MSATLADAVRAGLVPTDAEIAEKRERFSGVTRIGDLHAAEAGNATAVGRGLVAALHAGNAVQVAWLVRSLVATAVAVDERTDVIVAAPGGAR